MVIHIQSFAGIKSYCPNSVGLFEKYAIYQAVYLSIPLEPYNFILPILCFDIANLCRTLILISQF